MPSPSDFPLSINWGPRIAQVELRYAFLVFYGYVCVL